MILGREPDRSSAKLNLNRTLSKTGQVDLKKTLYLVKTVIFSPMYQLMLGLYNCVGCGEIRGLYTINFHDVAVKFLENFLLIFKFHRFHRPHWVWARRGTCVLRTTPG